MQHNSVKRARIMLNDAKDDTNNLVGVRNHHNNNILTNTGISMNSVLTDNIYLSICDDDDVDDPDENSAEAAVTNANHNTTATAEYVTIDRCTYLQQQQQPQNHNSTTNLQYCIATNAMASPKLNTGAAGTATCVSAAVLPTAVQLPSGCEIYLIKEFVQPYTNGNITANTLNSTMTTIKMEPAIDDSVKANTVSNNNVQLVANNVSFNANKTSTAMAKTNVQATSEVTKRSYILEAYKKRDDRRRATHNEVERRRRDKINSWIFKLKEMLPTDMSAMSSNNNEQQSKKSNINNQQQNAQNRQHAQNDSKSQILIKACEYIKTMQQEINSLRECLTENEKLRLHNQRLQQELNKLKRESINGTGNFNLTLNSLNNMCVDNTADADADADVDTIIVAATDEIPDNSLTCFTKRQLIIRDYVD